VAQRPPWPAARAGELRDTCTPWHCAGAARQGKCAAHRTSSRPSACGAAQVSGGRLALACTPEGYGGPHRPDPAPAVLGRCVLREGSPPDRGAVQVSSPAGTRPAFFAGSPIRFAPGMLRDWPAARALLHSLYGNLAGNTRPNFPHANRVSCSRMSGGRCLFEGAQFYVVPSVAMLGEEGHHVLGLCWVEDSFTAT
jgi:hypothetical protein